VGDRICIASSGHGHWRALAGTAGMLAARAVAWLSQPSRSAARLGGRAALATLADAGLIQSPRPLPADFGLAVLPDFFSAEEEAALDAHCSGALAKCPWEASHFDAVIQHYRERQLPLAGLPPLGAAVVARAQGAFPPQGGAVGPHMDVLHVLELAPRGAIAPHVDSVKFSGAVVAGLCLRSEALLQLTVDAGAAGEGRAPTAAAWARAAQPAALQAQPLQVTALLPRRCLYILTGEARYGWAHALPLGGEWQGRSVVRGPRGRLSIILRDVLPEGGGVESQQAQPLAGVL
jgi:alkylated DNA repair protein alkB family protein 7